MSGTTLIITYVGGGRFEGVYRIADQVHFRDRVDPGSSRSRKVFLDALAKVIPSVDREDVERKLMQAEVPESESNGSATQGRPLSLRVDDPWPEPVDGSALLDDMAETLSRFVALPDGGAEACALWAVHTFCFASADTTPRLGITSPEKGCGKSTLLDVLAALVARPLTVANVTPAALYRAVEIAKPTLLVDEADSFLIGKNPNDELRGVLNSGHQRGGSVIRCAGDDSEPREFATFAPTAIALIGRLPTTLEDRAVLIRMRRRAPGETIDRMRRSRIAEELEPIRQRVVRWVTDHRDELQDADPELPEQLSDRGRDNWRLLCAIADAAGGEWPELARATARQLNASPTDEPAASTLLLSDMQGLFEETREERLSTERILSALNTMEDRPWPTWRRGKEMSPHNLSRLLRAYGARPRTLRIRGEMKKGYSVEDLADAFARYLPSRPPAQPVTPLQARQDRDLQQLQSVTLPSDVTDRDRRNPFADNGCNDVTDQSGGSQEGVCAS